MNIGEWVRDGHKRREMGNRFFLNLADIRLDILPPQLHIIYLAKLAKALGETK